jgi:hypothetical protein
VVASQRRPADVPFADAVRQAAPTEAAAERDGGGSPDAAV